MDDRDLFDRDDKRPFVSKASRSESLHWSPRFLNRRPFLTVPIRIQTHARMLLFVHHHLLDKRLHALTQVKQLQESCTSQVPGHDSELVAKHVLSTAPVVGFTKAERFMTK